MDGEGFQHLRVSATNVNILTGFMHMHLNEHSCSCWKFMLEGGLEHLVVTFMQKIWTSTETR